MPLALKLEKISRFLRQALNETEITVSIPPQKIPHDWKPDGKVCCHLMGCGLTAVDPSFLPASQGALCLGDKCSEYPGCLSARASALRKIERLLKDEEADDEEDER